jgi:hypothetical protein
MVACLEKGQKLEDHFTAEQLDAPGDPAWDATYAEIMARIDRPVTHLCNQCGGPVTHTLPRGDGFFTYWCGKHVPTTPPTRRPGSRLCDVAGCKEEWRTDFWGVKKCYAHNEGALPGNAAPAPYDPSPAAYINSGFGTAPSPTGRMSSSNPAFCTLTATAQASIVLRESGAYQQPARGGADYPLTVPLK